MESPRGDSDPYCGHCGYLLRGATESSRCPECGKPLVEVLMRPAFQRRRAFRYRSSLQFIGMPIVSIAMGRYGIERYGHARGLVAIGDVATGIIAIGVVARGVFALGTVSIGVISLGSVAVGVCAVGALSGGALAVGGIAVGGIAIGGVAVAVLRAIGGAAYELPF